MPAVCKVYVVALLLFYSVASRAGVIEADFSHMILHYSYQLPQAPASVYATTVDVAKWWSSDHTYSGDAKNLSLSAKPGGCWCEKLPGGGVTHMSVLAAMPGKMLRLSGALGPLQAGALNGSLTFKFKPQGTGTDLEIDYLVSGFAEGGLENMAPKVDEVLSGNFKRLVQAAAQDVKPNPAAKS